MTLVTPSAAPIGQSAAPTAPPAPSAAASVPGAAVSVKIVQPVDGATVPKGNLVINVEAFGITLVDKMGSPPAPGEGHFIYYTGVDFIPTKAGRPARTAPGTFAASIQASYTWANPPAGKQALGVQLVNNDDTPLTPPVTARATVTVQ